jgi:hypothetical protein
VRPSSCRRRNTGDFDRACIYGGELARSRSWAGIAAAWAAWWFGIYIAWCHLTAREAVRDAIDRHIEERRKDEQFKERLRQRHETERALYERLAR